MYYPDDSSTNAWSGEAWTKMESAGCVFLPVAGYRNGTSVINVGTYGFYWSSSLNTDNPIHAWYVRFNSGGVSRSSYGYRYSGQSVRPVSE